MKTTWLKDIENSNHPPEQNSVVIFEDKFFVHLKLPCTRQEYSGPFETAEEADRKNVYIESGIVSENGYFIVLPIGMEAGTVCRCLGTFWPFYFEVKTAITEDDFQKQQTRLLGTSEVTVMPAYVAEVAAQERSVIVGFRSQLTESITLDVSLVDPYALEDDVWTIRIYGS